MTSCNVLKYIKNVSCSLNLSFFEHSIFIILSTESCVNPFLKRDLREDDQEEGTERSAYQGLIDYTLVQSNY